jgi:HlyD family secretion protein
MKRRIGRILLLLLLAASLAASWWWARSFPEQASQFLIDRGLAADRAAQLVSWAGGQPATQEPTPLRASGSIEGDEVAIVSEFGGRITSLDAVEGDEVQAGQVLVELDTSTLQAQMAQAEAAVAAAEANLDNVKAGTHPAEILAAQATVQQAIAQRDAAKTAWDSAQAILDNPQEIDAQIAQAQAAVSLAAVQIEQAQAQISAAKAERDRYRAQASLEEKGLYQVYQYQVEAAQAALEAAKADKAGADRTLAALQALRDNPLALISQVHLADQQYHIAAAGVTVAQAKLAELQAGPTPEQIAVAEAQVGKAQAAVTGLQVQLSKRTLRSPIDGVVTGRAAHAGEAAIAGATLLTVAGLDEVRLTIYVPEDELGRVYLGQQVQIEVDSFPGQAFAGVVSYISPEAEFTPKNVQTEKDRVNMVFAVRIRLPNPDHLLKPGMPADAVIGP